MQRVRRKNTASLRWVKIMDEEIIRLVVLISGSGSNLQAVLDAVRMRMLDAEVALVVSNRADAYGLKRAQKAGIETAVHELGPYKEDGSGRVAYDADLAQIVAEAAPDYVVLLGWMHILSDAFLRKFPYRVVNLHPALPGTFPGAHAIEDAWKAFQAGTIKETGLMVHLVPDERVDMGPVLAKEEVPIYPTDTLETLETRMHFAEHRLIVQTLDRLINGDE